MTATKIHHLNCASMAPFGPGFPKRMVAHCLLVEGADGLTLVDTGFGSADVADKWKRMGAGFVLGVRPAASYDETAVAQVGALGYSPTDVRNIVVTHLDLDHAGGLADFPDATVHVFADELDAATKRATLKERERYKPYHWAHGPSWLSHRVEGESWFGFDAVQALADDVLIVPTRGHTRGHSAVAVRRPSGGWFLHAGDAYFDAGQKHTPPTQKPGLKAFEAAMQTDKPARLRNHERLRALHAEHQDEVTMFCAHDASEYDALAAVTD